MKREAPAGHAEPHQLRGLVLRHPVVPEYAALGEPRLTVTRSYARFALAVVQHDTLRCHNLREQKLLLPVYRLLVDRSNLGGVLGMARISGALDVCDRGIWFSA